MRGRDIFLSCDEEGCEAEEYHASYGGTTFAELEDDAKAAGWTVHQRGRVHFCEDHARTRIGTVPTGLENR